MTEDPQNELPDWAVRVIPHVEGAELLGRHAVRAGLYFGGVAGLVAVLVLVIWLVVGVIVGFVSQEVFLGTTGAGGVVGLILGLVTRFTKKK